MARPGNLEADGHVDLLEEPRRQLAQAGDVLGESLPEIRARFGVGGVQGLDLGPAGIAVAVEVGLEDFERSAGPRSRPCTPPTPNRARISGSDSPSTSPAWASCRRGSSSRST
jgi:hypothetical protein